MHEHASKVRLQVGVVAWDDWEEELIKPSEGRPRVFCLGQYSLVHYIALPSVQYNTVM